MSTKQLSQLSDTHLRTALLHEANFTLTEIAKRERVNKDTIRRRLNEIGIERQQKRTQMRAVVSKSQFPVLEIPRWRQILHERVRSFGLTVKEANWLLSINPCYHVSVTRSPQLGSAKNFIRRELTSSFRFALSSQSWLIIERTILAAAILDGASSQDLMHLAGLTNGSARNFAMRLRNEPGFEALRKAKSQGPKLDGRIPPHPLN